MMIDDNGGGSKNDGNINEDNDSGAGNNCKNKNDNEYNGHYMYNFMR